MTTVYSFGSFEEEHLALGGLDTAVARGVRAALPYQMEAHPWSPLMGNPGSRAVVIQEFQVGARVHSARIHTRRLYTRVSGCSGKNDEDQFHVSEQKESRNLTASLCFRLRLDTM